MSAVGKPTENGTRVDGRRLRLVISRIRSAGVAYGNDETVIRSFLEPGILFELLTIAEQALPLTKMIDVWHVEYWDNAAKKPVRFPFTSEDEAKTYAIAECLRPHFLCLQVTGPHPHLVPDE